MPSVAMEKRSGLNPLLQNHEHRGKHWRLRSFVPLRGTQDDKAVYGAHASPAFAAVGCGVVLQADNGHSHLVRQATILFAGELPYPY